MVQVQQFETGNRYQLEILHQFGKRVKTKSRNAFGASSYVCSYKGKTMFDVIGEKLVRGIFDRPPPILNRVKIFLRETPTQVFSCEYCEILHNTYFEKHLQTAAF